MFVFVCVLCECMHAPSVCANVDVCAQLYRALNVAHTLRHTLGKLKQKKNQIYLLRIDKFLQYRKHIFGNDDN